MECLHQYTINMGCGVTPLGCGVAHWGCGVAHRGYGVAHWGCGVAHWEYGVAHLGVSALIGVWRRSLESTPGCRKLGCPRFESQPGTLGGLFAELQRP
jgi:hypothetical protein